MNDHDFLLQIFTVSFFGHRHIERIDETEEKLNELIVKILKEKEYVDFLVGRNGIFDQLVSSAIKRAQRKFRDDNSTHILVLPYPSAEFRNNEESFYDYYNEVEICPESGAAYFKNAIQVRNRMMIDRSNMCVFYVEHPTGGAYQSLRYAIKENKRWINIADRERI